MTTSATVTTTLQYTPPNSPANSGSVSYPVVANYDAMNVGQFDILSTSSAPVTNVVPFGSVTQCLVLILKNNQASDIGIKINGGVQLAGSTASISYSSSVNTITGLTGMTTAMVGMSIKIGNSATPANNGTFTIVTVVGLTSVTVANAAGVTDAGGDVFWVLGTTLDNFKIPPGGTVAYAASQAPGVPSSTPPVAMITSCSVTSYAIPLTGYETISYFVFGV